MQQGQLKTYVPAVLTPPAEAWQNIASTLDSDAKKQALLLQIANQQQQPPSDMWQKIDAAQQAEQGKIVRLAKKRNWPLIAATAAASIAFIIFLSLALFNKPSNGSLSTTVSKWKDSFNTLPTDTHQQALPITIQNLRDNMSRNNKPISATKITNWQNTLNNPNNAFTNFTNVVELLRFLEKNK